MEEVMKSALRVASQRLIFGGTAHPPQVRSSRDDGLLGEFADLFVSLKHLLDGYHPERHYMRGPGPAWYAKHSTVQAS
jgi:hypothetical protein